MIRSNNIPLGAKIEITKFDKTGPVEGIWLGRHYVISFLSNNHDGNNASGEYVWSKHKYSFVNIDGAIHYRRTIYVSKILDDAMPSPPSVNITLLENEYKNYTVIHGPKRDVLFTSPQKFEFEVELQEINQVEFLANWIHFYYERPSKQTHKLKMGGHINPIYLKIPGDDQLYLTTSISDLLSIKRAKQADQIIIDKNTKVVYRYRRYRSYIDSARLALYGNKKLKFCSVIRYFVPKICGIYAPPHF